MCDFLNLYQFGAQNESYPLYSALNIPFILDFLLEFTDSGILSRW